MNLEALAASIPQLSNFYTLAGFILVVVAGLSWLFKGMSFAQLSGAATERLLSKLIVGCLGLGLLSLVFGFVTDLQRQAQPPVSAQVIEGVNNSTIAQSGCEAAASADGQAKRSGQSSGQQNVSSQTIRNVEGSTIAQGGCDAVAAGQQGQAQ